MRFLVTIVPRNDKNKRNILGMIKTKNIIKIAKSKNVIGTVKNGKNKKDIIGTTKQEECYPELFPFVILSVSEGSFVANAPSE